MMKLLTQEAAETIADLHYSAESDDSKTHAHNLQVADEQGLSSKIAIMGFNNLVTVARQEYPHLFKV